jgi:hypothetical protein
LKELTAKNNERWIEVAEILKFNKMKELLKTIDPTEVISKLRLKSTSDQHSTLEVSEDLKSIRKKQNLKRQKQVQKSK